MKTLLLRLNAPMQSWGSGSLYDQRETDDMPTKSGVIGLLAAAFGRSRGDSVDDLIKLKFGVRIDAPGTRMADFQVTHMGGKLYPNTSKHFYLCDATFLVGFSTEDEEQLRMICNACNSPKFSLFLGRRSCPPTFPLNLGIRDKELYQALLDEPWQISDWNKKAFGRYNDKTLLRIVIDDEDGKAIKKDVPVSYSPFKREYGFRTYAEKEPKVITREVNDITLHDPMLELR